MIWPQTIIFVQIGQVYVGRFAIIDNVIYCVDPPMLDWVNPLYFLSLADIQEVHIRSLTVSAASTCGTLRQNSILCRISASCTRYGELYQV